jgi:hypothetical protein
MDGSLLHHYTLGIFAYIEYDLISGVTHRYVPGYPNAGATAQLRAAASAALVTLMLEVWPSGALSLNPHPKYSPGGPIQATWIVTLPVTAKACPQIRPLPFAA